MNGGFGFGRSGFGPGGGGTGWGTIGTGRYGTIGHGSGTGSGYGVGGGRGGMRGRSAAVPTVSIGQPNAQGDLDKAIIRRYIKRNIQKIQYCYEKELLAKPGLAGHGHRRSSSSRRTATSRRRRARASTEVANCVAGVIKDIEFPKPKGGGGVQVNYPFTFRPAGSVSAQHAPDERQRLASRSAAFVFCLRRYYRRSLSNEELEPSRSVLRFRHEAPRVLLLVAARGMPDKSRNESIEALERGHEGVRLRSSSRRRSRGSKRRPSCGRTTTRLGTGSPAHTSASRTGRRHRTRRSAPSRGAGAGHVSDGLRLHAVQEGHRPRAKEQARARTRSRKRSSRTSRRSTSRSRASTSRRRSAQPGSLARALLPRPHLPRHGRAEGGRRALTKARQARAAEAAPWVALGELYRKWDYTDEALQVAQQGAVCHPRRERGLRPLVRARHGVRRQAHGRQGDRGVRQGDRERADNHKAKFQRGQAYFRKGDFSKAKKDLEEFAKAGGSSLEFAKQQARRCSSTSPRSRPRRRTRRPRRCRPRIW